MSIQDISNKLARRTVLVLAVPLIPLVLVAGYLGHLVAATLEYWDGCTPRAIGRTIANAWNGY